VVLLATNASTAVSGDSTPMPFCWPNPCPQN
jgi:hypothetical protein